MFKKRRGIHIPYNKQGLIHFVCVNYNDMPEVIKSKILRLCMDTAGTDYMALFDVVTKDTMTIQNIAGKHKISEKRLYKLRKEFYETW